MGRKKGKTPIFSTDNVSGLGLITINKTNRPDICKIFGISLKKIEAEEARLSQLSYGGYNGYLYQQSILEQYQRQYGHLMNGIRCKPSAKKSNKRGSRGGQHKRKIKQNKRSTLERLLSTSHDSFNNIHDRGDGVTYFDNTGLFTRESFENFCDEHAVDSGNKMIYFYEDIMDSNNKSIFYDVYDLDEFCRENGIEISDYDCQQIMGKSIVHCCVNPYARTIDGSKMLMVDSSYGGLRWLCCDGNSELEEDECYARHGC